MVFVWVALLRDGGIADRNEKGNFRYDARRGAQVIVRPVPRGGLDLPRTPRHLNIPSMYATVTVHLQPVPHTFTRTAAAHPAMYARNTPLWPL